MTKPFLTYEQQINKLANDKCLVIPNVQTAKEVLQNIGYFSLIGGYKHPFINPMTRKYQNSTTFNDVLSLYIFDKQLRELTFKYLCEVEQRIRQLISYEFCKTYGESQTEYLNPNKYNKTSHNKTEIGRLISVLDYHANKNTEHPYLVHQRKTYNNVPLWATANALTFGQLSHFYNCLPNKIQSAIAKEYVGINESKLAAYLSVLTLFRNVCAHNERLFSFRLTTMDFPDSILHSKLHIQQKGVQYLQGKKDLFGLVLALRHLLPSKSFLSFKIELQKLLAAYLKRSTKIGEKSLLSMMGFPTNWKNITRYKI